MSGPIEYGQAQDWADRRKALDPSQFRPRYYVIDITCGVAIGDQASGSVVLDNVPFVLDCITHITLGVPAADGQFLVTIRDDQAVYNTRPAVAAGLFGDVYGGSFVIPLPLRCLFRGSATISADIENLLFRGAAGALTWQLQLIFHGFQRWSST